MKSAFKKLLICIVAVITVFACVSCSYLPSLDFLPSFGKKPSGLYGDIDEKGFGHTYNFVGDKVTYTRWNNGKSEVVVDAPYEIKGGKLKITSDEYFDGSVNENGKYVVSKSISFEEDDAGNETLKIGVNSFTQMQESDLPKPNSDGTVTTDSLKGTYGTLDKNGTGYTYTFADGKVTYSFWDRGEEQEIVCAPYQITDGNIKITSDKKFDGSTSEAGKYVMTKPISLTKNESGEETLKIGNAPFVKLEDEDLPENPANPTDPENNTSTTVTMTDFKDALIEISTTENKNFEASYSLREVHAQDGSHTEEINYYMEIKANGTDRYLKFSIDDMNTYGSTSQGNFQVVEIWYKGGNSYIKAVTWQLVKGKTMDKETNSIKASGQTFDAVCQNIGYNTNALLLMGSELNSILSDSAATITNHNGTMTYNLDCTGKTSALTTLYRVSKAFAVKLAADKFDDADVKYTYSTSEGFKAEYTASFTQPGRTSNTNGTVKFKSFNSQITVPSDVSSAEDKGSGYKSWYSGLDVPHR